MITGRRSERVHYRWHPAYGSELELQMRELSNAVGGASPRSRRSHGGCVRRGADGQPHQ
jgi:hypothetical protein